MILSVGMAHFLRAVDEGAGYVAIGIYVFFAIATISMSWQLMSFARLSEHVFRALDMPDPSNVDLVKSTRKVRLASDPAELGTFFFKY